MIEHHKAMADIRTFVATRLAEGHSLPVDEIGELFLSTRRDDYPNCTATDLQPFVQAIIDEYSPQHSAEDARRHAEELRAYVQQRPQQH